MSKRRIKASKVRAYGSRSVRAFKRLPKRVRLGVWLGIGLVALLAYPAVLSKNQFFKGDATFYYVPPPNSFIVGQTVPLELWVRTGKQKVNAVSALIRFNPAQAEVVNMTTVKSFCTFYPKNNFNNQQGTIQVSCGTPNPGFSGESLLIHLNIRAKTAGSITFDLDDDHSKVLANDGKGSNIIGSMPDQLVLKAQAF